MLYEDLCAVDVFHNLEKPIAQGMIGLDKNGIMSDEIYSSIHEPVLISKQPVDRDCFHWKNHLFNFYNLLPAGCIGCWKIVSRPKTLKELFALQVLQEKLAKEKGYCGKCGIDKRSFTYGIYSGFFYCDIENGLSGARQRFKELKPMLDKILPEDEHRRHYLKRGCTEMELTFGPSDRWVENAPREKFINDSWKIGPIYAAGQPKNVKAHIMRKCIEWAWERGDDTVWDFAKPESLLRHPVSYQDSEHKASDFKIPKLDIEVAEEPDKLIEL